MNYLVYLSITMSDVSDNLLSYIFNNLSSPDGDLMTLLACIYSQEWYATVEPAILSRGQRHVEAQWRGETRSEEWEGVLLYAPPIPGYASPAGLRHLPAHVLEAHR